MKSARFVFALLVAVAFCILAPSLFAQTAATGALSGTITDSTGSVVPNATVTVTSTATSQVRTAMTGGDGSYRIGLLPPGDYRIKFEAAGFKAIEIPTVTVTVTEIATLNQVLTVGSQTQEVTVQANVEAVQTQSSTVGSVIGTQDVTALPLTSRNYTALLSLSAGANASVQNASAIGKGNAATAVNGSNTLQNNYQMDGTSVVNWSSNGAGGGDVGGSTEGFIGIPNPDAIQEFKIQTSLYDAGYGRNPGANMNVVTKSGSNDFHGTAFEFLRNTALNANDWFLNRAEKPRGVLNQNQFGGVFGGPIKKDKLFFFVAYQETEQKNGIAAGGLSNPVLPVIPTGDRTTATWLDALYSTYCGKKGAQGGVAIACTPGGVGAQINPVAIKILQLQFPNGNYYLPSGSNGTTPIPFSVPSIFHDYQGMANGDYVINSKNTLAMRFFYSTDPGLEGFGNGATSLPGFSQLSQFADSESLVKLTSILSTNLVNEARISYQRYVTNSSTPVPFTNTQVGITPESQAIPVLTDMSIAGFFIGANNFGINSTVVNQYGLGDQISWTHGEHTIRAGFDGDYYRWNWFFPSLLIGQLTFSSFPDFLLGLPGCSPVATIPPCSATNPGGTPNNPATNGTSQNNFATTNAVGGFPSGLDAHIRGKDFDAFVQDDYKFSKRLTINVGLRWEYDPLESESNGKLTNIWPSLLATVPYPVVSVPCTGVIFPAPCAGGSYVGYVIPRNFNLPGAIPAGVFRNNQNGEARERAPLDNFAPRLGFAWQPLSSPRFVVRGGVGYFYDRLNGETMHDSAIRGAPYAINLAQSGQANFASTLANPFPRNDTNFPASPAGWLPRWTTLNNLSSNITENGLEEKFVTPLVYEWNLNTQYEFAPSWVLEIGYVGSRGIHLWNGGTGATGGEPLNPSNLASSANPVNCGYDGVPTDCITTDKTSNTFLRVPYYGLAPTFNVEATSLDFKFNSLQTTVRKQFSHGLTLQAAYTWSRAFISSYVGMNQSFPVAAEYGLNPLYHPQRLTVNYSWNLPFGHSMGLKGKFLNGWNLSGVTTIQNGTPLTVTDSRGGSIFGSVVTSNAQLSGAAPIATTGSADSRVNAYLNKTAFTFAPCLNSSGVGLVPPSPTGVCPAGEATAFGNSGLGVALGPGQNNYDIALLKTTTVGGLHENATLQFRAEFFNAFNHPQFSNPGVAFNSATSFGTITSLSVNPRLVQFGLKYIF
jgi:Carboxypeptidase regulatory-like domain